MVLRGVLYWCYWVYRPGVTECVVLVLQCCAIFNRNFTDVTRMLHLCFLVLQWHVINQQLHLFHLIESDNHTVMHWNNSYILLTCTLSMCFCVPQHAVLG